MLVDAEVGGGHEGGTAVPPTVPFEFLCALVGGEVGADEAGGGAVEGEVTAVRGVVEGEACGGGGALGEVGRAVARGACAVGSGAGTPTRRVADAFAAYFGDDAHTVERQTASEDMSEIPRAFGVPFTYWMIGGTDPERYAEAAKKGTVAQDIPVNHSATFAPVVQPTLDTGVSAVTVAALAWLGDRAA